MSNEDELTLPDPKLPELPAVDQRMTDAEINNLHLQMSNLEINILYKLWPQVNSISAACKMIDASIKAVKHQRDILCLPYGYSGKATREDVVFPTLDD